MKSWSIFSIQQSLGIWNASAAWGRTSHTSVTHWLFMAEFWWTWPLTVSLSCLTFASVYLGSTFGSARHHSVCTHLGSPGHLPEVCHGPEKTEGKPCLTKAGCTLLLDMTECRESMGTHVTHILTRESESRELLKSLSDFLWPCGLVFAHMFMCVMICGGSTCWHMHVEARA